MLAERLGPALANAPGRDHGNPTPAATGESQLLSKSETQHIYGMYQWHFENQLLWVLNYISMSEAPIAEEYVNIWSESCQ